MRKNSTLWAFAVFLIVVLFWLAIGQAAAGPLPGARYSVFRVLHPHKHKPGKKYNTVNRSRRAHLYRAKHKSS